MRGQIGLFLSITLLVIVALVVGIFIWNYNGLVKARRLVDGTKAQVATVLQRRLDLIPNLVETVKGYAQHERSTLEAITKARNDAQKVLAGVNAKESLSNEDLKTIEASQSELTRALKSIFALAENYPDLKASANFLALQDQLEGTENRISVERQRYNYVVTYYNSKTETFPGNLVAALFGFKEKALFEAKEEAEEAIKVKF